MDIEKKERRKREEEGDEIMRIKKEMTEREKEKERR